MSEHFKREEFVCKCGCGFDCMDEELVGVLEDLRRHFQCAVVIHSGNRCKVHNKSIGGAAHSQHLNGIAVDVWLKDFQTDQVYDYLDSKYPDRYGIGCYPTWVHLDMRKPKARW